MINLKGHQSNVPDGISRAMLELGGEVIMTRCYFCQKFCVTGETYQLFQFVKLFYRSEFGNHGYVSYSAFINILITQGFEEEGSDTY